ncbi:adenine deaminase C-terminal domain-containing protein [Clostridium sp. HMP27]|uniref:adenine deaminase n=1 Tax=Clostridium sp. HMP27 TaxID=1487921 RepID=UPI00052C28A4|nr:adenine deaminase C-terminal domain-containing protein [Clostridium sp. HMP27]KGK87630.1 adenine deaminase [Clostridium sp. HMP27]
MMDLIIKNIQVFNVYSKKFIKSSVVIKDGKFLYTTLKDIKNIRANRVIEGEGKYLIPSLIDIHLHIESSMVTPEAFSHELIKDGVTTVVAEPHEIANVFGIVGIKEMIKRDENCTADIFYGIPSSVPSTELETSGAEIGIEEFEELIKNPKVICLGEVMNYVEVIKNPESKINKFLSYIKNKYPKLIIEGHCPRIVGEDLYKFIFNGVDSDHTQHTPETIEDRFLNGMFVEIQDKSLTEENIKFIEENDIYNNFCFVTDDVMADNFINEGHLNNIIKKAIKIGMKPERAITFGTLNPALRMDLKDRGAVAPGKIADFIILDNVEKFSINSVYKNGECVYEEGEKYQYTPSENKFPKDFYNSVKLEKINEEDLKIKANVENGRVKCRIINVKNGSTFTGEVFDYLDVVNGYIDWEGSPYALIGVFERHKGTGNVTLALASGDTIKRGAVATTYAHDHHNLLVIGKSPVDIVCAANFIIENQGGYCVCENESILASVKLNVAGILSEKSVEEVGFELSKVKEAMKDLGYNHYNPVMSLSTNSLPVSPELKITDMGLVKVKEGKIVNLIVEE